MADSPATGAVKNDADKLRWDLLPWDAVAEVVKVLGHGAKKYADRNWEKGLKFSRIFAAAQRHLTAWFNGETYDDESKLNHLAHAACDVLFLLTFSCRFRSDLDDRPRFWDHIQVFTQLPPNDADLVPRARESGGM